MPDNFPDEFFYQQATADGLVSAGGNNVLAEFDLEGAIATGPVVDGDQLVFSRIRYKITGGLKADTDYKITHPPAPTRSTRTRVRRASSSPRTRGEAAGVRPPDWAHQPIPEVTVVGPPIAPPP